MAQQDRPDTLALECSGAGTGIVVKRGDDAIETADGLGRNQRDGVADGPGDVEKRLRRLIAGPAPVLACERSLGEEQRAGIAGGGVEKVRGLVPVVGDRGIGALG